MTKNEFKKTDVLKMLNLSESDYVNFTRAHNGNKNNPRNNPRALFNNRVGTGNEIIYSEKEMMIWYFGIFLYRNKINPLLARTAVENMSDINMKIILSYPVGIKIIFDGELALDYIRSELQ